MWAGGGVWSPRLPHCGIEPRVIDAAWKHDLCGYELSESASWRVLVDMSSSTFVYVFRASDTLSLRQDSVAQLNTGAWALR